MKKILCVSRVVTIGTLIAALLAASPIVLAQSSAKPTNVSSGTGSVEAQMEQMREQLQVQQEEIEQLKRQLEHGEAAQRVGQSLADSGGHAYEDLKSAVDVIQSRSENREETVATLTQKQKEMEKQVEHPDEIHYKGITISPKGSFIEAATVYRSAATGGDINTPLTSIPLAHSDEAQMSEFYGSARQSRIALKATGKLPGMTMTGYYEMDWLGAGSTSNNNQSNSYVARQRQLWVRAALNNGWSFTGGQMWSLATETRDGMAAGNEALPSTIDPQYTAGLVWARQYAFRVTKDVNHTIWLGASAENPQTLNPAGTNLPTNVLLGSAGTGGGLYNPLANYSFNLAPDLIAKAVYQPGWGHYELFGIARFFRDRIYPATGNPYNDSTVTGGVGGSARVSAMSKKMTIGLKGLYGQGIGRYGDSAIADVTLRPDGQIAPLRAFSTLGTLEFNPTKRLTLWSNYGGDYVFRRYFGRVGYGSPLTDMTGCNTEAVPGSGPVNGATGFSPSAPAHCEGNSKDVQELSVGYWFNFYAGSKGTLRQGIQYSRIQRDLWSGVGGMTNPGGGAQGTDNAFWTSFRYFLP